MGSTSALHERKASATFEWQGSVNVMHSVGRCFLSTSIFSHIWLSPLTRFLPIHSRTILVSSRQLVTSRSTVSRLLWIDDDLSSGNLQASLSVRYSMSKRWALALFWLGVIMLRIPILRIQKAVIVIVRYFRQPYWNSTATQETLHTLRKIPTSIRSTEKFWKMQATPGHLGLHLLRNATEACTQRGRRQKRFFSVCW